MTLDYIDLLSPNPLVVEGVGRIRKVKLEELQNDGEHIGLPFYISFIYILGANKKTAKEILKTLGDYSDALIEKISSQTDVYDMLMMSTTTIRAMLDALSFFICEDIKFDPSSNTFIVYKTKEGQIEQVGIVDKNNFADVRDVILESNCLSYNAKADVEAVSDDNELLKKWKEAEAMNQDLQQKTDTEDAAFGNVISKLCASNVGINFENVWNLTVYQAIDQLQQLGYLRNVELAERSFSIYGGEHYDANEWLHSIQAKSHRKDN